MKSCRKCLRALLPEAFQKRYRTCKLCQRARKLAYAKAYRITNRETLNQKNREYQKKFSKEISRRRLVVRRQNPHYRYSRFIRESKRRGIEFNLTYEQYYSFWGKPCRYCGEPETFGGLDRVKNNLGYLSSNVVPCCFPCNRMKGPLDDTEFFEKIKLILTYELPGAYT